MPVLPLIEILKRESSLGISVCLGTLNPGVYDELRAAGLVDKQEGKVPFSRFFAALRKKIPHLPLGLSQPHVEDFGPLDAKEKFGMILTRFLTKLTPRLGSR